MPTPTLTLEAVSAEFLAEGPPGLTDAAGAAFALSPAFGLDRSWCRGLARWLRQVTREGDPVIDAGELHRQIEMARLELGVDRASGEG